MVVGLSNRSPTLGIPTVVADHAIRFPPDGSATFLTSLPEGRCRLDISCAHDYLTRVAAARYKDHGYRHGAPQGLDRIAAHDVGLHLRRYFTMAVTVLDKGWAESSNQVVVTATRKK
jgi:hypothetical protein